MTAYLPHGPRPVLALCVLGLVYIAVQLLRPWLRDRHHERSIHHREKGWRE